jgi:hypothetical protein
MQSHFDEDAGKVCTKCRELKPWRLFSKIQRNEGWKMEQLQRKREKPFAKMAL